MTNKSKHLSVQQVADEIVDSYVCRANKRYRIPLASITVPTAKHINEDEEHMLFAALVRETKPIHRFEYIAETSGADSLPELLIKIGEQINSVKKNIKLNTLGRAVFHFALEYARPMIDHELAEAFDRYMHRDTQVDFEESHPSFIERNLGRKEARI